MGFSAKQVQALRRDLNSRNVSARARPMDANSRTSKAGMRSRKPIGSLVLMAGTGKRWNPAACWHERTVAHSWSFISPKCASPCMPTETTLVREGHGSGEGRGTSPGEVHDIALKAAETDATKRALATFGKPFGLELYRKSQPAHKQSFSQPT